MPHNDEVDETNANAERIIASQVAQSLAHFEAGLSYLILSEEHGEDSAEAREFLASNPDAVECRDKARRILKLAFQDMRHGK